MASYVEKSQLGQVTGNSGATRRKEISQEERVVSRKTHLFQLKARGRGGNHELGGISHSWRHTINGRRCARTCKKTCWRNMMWKTGREEWTKVGEMNRKGSSKKLIANTWRKEARVTRNKTGTVLAQAGRLVESPEPEEEELDQTCSEVLRHTEHLMCVVRKMSAVDCSGQRFEVECEAWLTQQRRRGKTGGKTGATQSMGGGGASILHNLTKPRPWRGGAQVVDDVSSMCSH